MSGNLVHTGRLTYDWKRYQERNFAHCKQYHLQPSRWYGLHLERVSTKLIDFILTVRDAHSFYGVVHAENIRNMSIIVPEDGSRNLIKEEWDYIGTKAAKFTKTAQLFVCPSATHCRVWFLSTLSNFEVVNFGSWTATESATCKMLQQRRALQKSSQSSRFISSARLSQLSWKGVAKEVSDNRSLKTRCLVSLVSVHTSRKGPRLRNTASLLRPLDNSTTYKHANKQINNGRSIPETHWCSGTVQRELPQCFGKACQTARLEGCYKEEHLQNMHAKMCTLDVLGYEEQTSITKAR